ncbi:MAG: MBL fold metallo-hydrolase [Chlorobium limicola]|uniref:Beta-lactamase domain protein n=1 Tax=Chlorobium limicola (strain DSM 245 / NBRC 103803 / 6330) TaxID=290315 RepID=B3EF07_CHLL2|nr:MBL fold metallo-hydrolase [Chlorobium limicola]ACD90869.1 beta-lactamase domain protein [Chlorobium limicola DSM 245]NTV20534.1 MBL fold metallo-hydrolase [Chlorobium limicola]
MELQFYGAAARVTGTCHMLRTGGFTLLLDCGLIQGSREEEALNGDPFPFDPSSVDAVVLSHGHIDHSGRLPLLVKRGFNGPVYTQHATADLSRVLLLDSASLSERDADYRRRHPADPEDRHAEPLYTREDALRAVSRMRGMEYREEREILPGVRLRFLDAGHILGSAVVELGITEEGRKRTIVFSGDLGQYGSPVLNDPETPEHADLVMVESTYGDRMHRSFQDTLAELGEIFRTACRECGNILIPAFSIGRSQELLYLFATCYEAWELEKWQVYLDSPMAIEASRIYWDYPALLDEDALMMRNNPAKLPPLDNLHFTAKVEASRKINDIRKGAIIIAGSGMCNGGRILHHLKHNIWRPECRVIITGFQAPGTLGREIVNGAGEVFIHGRSYRVAAAVHTIGGLSAHGDRSDLLRWMSGFRNRPDVYVVHGDGEAKRSFRNAIEDELQLHASIPNHGDLVKF